MINTIDSRVISHAQKVANYFAKFGYSCYTPAKVMLFDAVILALANACLAINTLSVIMTLASFVIILLISLNAVVVLRDVDFGWHNDNPLVKQHSFLRPAFLALSVIGLIVSVFTGFDGRLIITNLVNITFTTGLYLAAVEYTQSNDRKTSWEDTFRPV